MKLKSVFFICLSVYLLCFTSCKDDVDTIVGTWQCNTMEFDIEATDPTVATTLKMVMGVMNEVIEDLTLTFNDNNTYSMSLTIPNVETGGSLTQTEKGSYSLNNGKLIIDDEAVKYELTKQQLTLRAGADELLGDLADMEGMGIDLKSITKFDVAMKFDKK